MLEDCLLTGAPACPTLDSVLTMNRRKIERVSRALADETRLRIFEAISSCEEMNCGQIVSLRGVTPATVSHHLRILMDAGLIECHREGQFVYSKVNPKALGDYTRELAALTRKRKKWQITRARKH
jgi:ArsR family transcriptional regulator, arsenate/arsenite/antimonite-responsive transcriptional repressor